MSETQAAPVVFREQIEAQSSEKIATDLSAAIMQPVASTVVKSPQVLHPLDEPTQQAIDAMPEQSAAELGKDEKTHDKGTWLSRVIGGVFAKKRGLGPSKDLLVLKQDKVNRDSGIKEQ